MKKGLQGALDGARTHRVPTGNGGDWARFRQGTVSCNHALEGSKHLIHEMALCSLHTSKMAPNIKSDKMVLLIEDFTLRKMSSDKSLLSPVVVGSMMEALASKSSLEICIKRFSASDAKTTNTDLRLKQYKMFEAHSRHSRDAIRHMILFLKSISNELAKGK